MKILFKRFYLVVMVTTFGVLILLPQVLRHRNTVERLRLKSPLDDVIRRVERTIAGECLKDLKNPVARSVLRDAISTESESLLLVLIKRLPHCTRYPPRKFIAFFVRLLSDTLEERSNEEFDFESPWPNRTHLNNRTDQNFCPELPARLRGKINITFNGNYDVATT